MLCWLDSTAVYSLVSPQVRGASTLCYSGRRLLCYGNVGVHWGLQRNDGPGTHQVWLVAVTMYCRMHVEHPLPLCSRSYMVLKRNRVRAHLCRGMIADTAIYCYLLTGNLNSEITHWCNLYHLCTIKRPSQGILLIHVFWCSHDIQQDAHTLAGPSVF